MESSEDAWKKLVCVEYPGSVKNAANMISTLGGMRSISTAYSEKNRRLELRFRPDDIYCKPVCGDKHQSSAFLLKVKRRRRRDGQVNFSYTVIGSVDTVFKFTNLCDFQYLPMSAPRDNLMKMENIYDTLVPDGLPPLSWIVEPAEYFLPPAVFSRMDSVQAYMYRKDSDQEKSVPHNIIGRTRRRRSIHARFITFDIPDAPKKPRDRALKLLHVKFLQNEHINQIRQLFEERPVWSKNALMCMTKYSSDQLKFLLPAAAYYFVTGPWRVMWVKYGYDPRLDPTSRIYQTLDYRLRKKGNIYESACSRPRPIELILPNIRIQSPCTFFLSETQIHPRLQPVEDESQFESLAKDGFAFRVRPRIERIFDKRAPVGRGWQQAGGLRTRVKAKRSYCNYLLPYKLTSGSRPKMSVISRDLVTGDGSSAQPKAKEDPVLFQESNYIFRAGTMPPSRQMFYQYCDVNVPEIEAMLEKLPMPLPNAKCHERDGWLPAGFADQCREIINNIILSTLRQTERSKGLVAGTSKEGEDASKDREYTSDWSDSDDGAEEDEEENEDWEADFEIALE